MEHILSNINNHNELYPMIYDILRTLTMQFIVQFLVVSSSNTSLTFFDPIFIQITLFLILGVMVFWMIVYKVFEKNDIIQKILTKMENGK